MFGRQPKNAGPTVEQLRQAYRRRVFQVLGPAEEDLTTSDDLPALIPASAANLGLASYRPLAVEQPSEVYS